MVAIRRARTVGRRGCTSTPRARRAELLPFAIHTSRYIVRLTGGGGD
jgi:hypothetical protein